MLLHHSHSRVIFISIDTLRGRPCLAAMRTLCRRDCSTFRAHLFKIVFPDFKIMFQNYFWKSWFGSSRQNGWHEQAGIPKRKWKLLAIFKKAANIQFDIDFKFVLCIISYYFSSITFSERETYFLWNLYCEYLHLFACLDGCRQFSWFLPLKKNGQTLEA